MKARDEIAARRSELERRAEEKGLDAVIVASPANVKAFHSTSSRREKQLWRYALSVAGAIIINYVSMKLLVEVCGVWPTPAKTLTTVISSIYSFLAAKFYTFRREGV